MINNEYIISDSDDDDYPLIELVKNKTHKKREVFPADRKCSLSLVPYSSSSSSSDSSVINDHISTVESKVKSNTRKRKREPEKWLKNLRKYNYQQNKNYINTKKVLIPEKKIKIENDCQKNCRFQCTKNFNMELRELIKNSYYTLNQNEKYHFLLQNTKRTLVKRKKDKNNNYRSFSFEYYFEKLCTKLRVCKKFFLNTLLISQKPVYNVHLKKDDCGTPQPCLRGKFTKDRISQDDKIEIRKHIDSFPHVEAHYCRAKTKKFYLQGDLNLQKMYDLYAEQCQENGRNPQKMWLYRKIFNFEFNLDFHVAKSDRCSTCEEYKLAELENRRTHSMETSYQNHRIQIASMRLAKEQDKQSVNKNCVLICFDLENVLNFPKSEVSVLFYKQKLNVYNLTATCANQVYCAIWPETTSGRSGNDLASAFIQILELVLLKNPGVNEIITWSDSCVAQNRNSIISIAVINLLKKYPKINRVTMKYSIAGHSCVQEVDNVHSRIERFVKTCDIWSPKSLIQILKKIDRRNSKKFNIIEMNRKILWIIKEFQKCFDVTKYLSQKFTNSAFLKQIYLRWNTILNIVPTDLVKLTLDKRKTRNLNEPNTLINIRPVGVKLNTHVTQNKIEDIEFAYRWMPLEDKEYMQQILSVYNN